MSKRALVTGGNSGIGLAVARLLRDKGYEVTITGRSAGRVEESARELGASGIVADLADPSSLQRVAEPFLREGLDLLVNNAGVAAVLPLDQLDEAGFDHHFDVNVKAPLLLTSRLLPALEARKGAVAMVSSIISVHGAANFSIYAASKGAIEAAVRSLAIELAPRGVRINAVAPGAVDTPIFSKMGFDEATRKQIYEHHESTIPMGRLADPAEIAEVVVAQAEAGYVTGSVWTVDGGVDA